MKFCTIIDANFVPGFVTLMASMARYFEKGTLHFVLVRMGKFEGHQLQLIAQVAGKFGITVQAVDSSDLGSFKVPAGAAFPERFRTALQKLLVFKLESEAPMCFLDADLLCVGDPTAIAGFQPFTAAMVFGIGLPHSVQCRPMFSSGLFVFQPSLDLYDELQEFALEYHGDLSMPDQLLLNEFFYQRCPHEVHLLGIEWEALKRVKVAHPKLWPEGRIKFIHYVGIKPWDQRAMTEQGYAGLVKLWRDKHAVAIA